MPIMTTRSDILKAVQSLLNGRNDDTFTMGEVLDAMHRAGTRYADQTIRTHVGSVMCVNAPPNHAVAYADFVRVDRGRYRLAAPMPIAGSFGPREAPVPQAPSAGGPRPEPKNSRVVETPPVDAAQLALVVAALSHPPLTTRVAAAEAALEGLDAHAVGVALEGHALSVETAVAAMAVRASLGRVSDLIHASVICGALPRILEPGERVTVRPSLASGNDPTRLYDLETDRRVAEFKAAVWQTGSNVMRKRALFADLVALAMDPRPLRKQLFVVGDQPARFLRSSKSEAHMILQRADERLRLRFVDQFGAAPISVADFSVRFASDVEIVDLGSVLPELRTPVPG